MCFGEAMVSIEVLVKGSRVRRAAPFHLFIALRVKFCQLVSLLTTLKKQVGDQRSKTKHQFIFGHHGMRVFLFSANL